MTINTLKIAAVFRRRKTDSKHRNGGFSLIELMITMAIFLIVIAAVFQVMRLSLLQRNTVSTRIDATKSARIALNYIRRDAVNAGLSYHNIGGLTPNGFVNQVVKMPTGTNVDDRDMLTGIICGNNVTANLLNPNAGARMDSMGFVTRDLTFNNGEFISIAKTTTSGTDVTVNTGTGQAAVSKPYDLYLLETATSQVVGLVTAVPSTSSVTLGFGGSDPLGINQAANGTGNNISLLVGTNITGTLKKINLVSYSVTANGVLVRTSYGNNTGKLANQQIQARELIYNVQDFQVKYLLDDGTVTDDPSSGNTSRTNQQNMNRVIQMEVTITVMQNNMGLQAQAPVTIKEVLSVRNLRYTIN